MTQQSPLPLPLPELPLTAEEAQRARLVDFTVTRESGLPLNTQLDWKIRGMLARGVLRAGDRVPSVRELAAFAGVNVNTARAAYRQLEDDGLISSEQGRGTYVTEAAGQVEELGAIASEAAAKARRIGVDNETLAAAIHSDPGDSAAGVQIAPFPEPDPELSERALRSALREQIGRLEAELATYAWDDPQTPAPPHPRGGEPVGRIISTEELERTRAELIDRLRRLRGEAARRGAEQEGARAQLEAMVDDPAGHRWELITNDATGDPGCKSWHVVPAWGPLGRIMGWWRVKVSSGCPLAAPLAAARP